MAQLTLLPAAENDLLDQAEYYDAQSGMALGDRFIAACEEGFARLAAFPESGTALPFKHSRLQTIRFILVPGFDSILILYTFSGDQVRVVRVLHGKRDVERLLGTGGGL